MDREIQNHLLANTAEGLFPFDFSVPCYITTYLKDSTVNHEIKSKTHILSAMSHYYDTQLLTHGNYLFHLNKPIQQCVDFRSSHTKNIKEESVIICRVPYYKDSKPWAK